MRRALTKEPVLQPETQRVPVQAPSGQSRPGSRELQGDKVVAWKPAPRCWGLLSDRPAFFAYVEAEVRSLLPARPAAGAR
jgi:hypothetical protein